MIKGDHARVVWNSRNKRRYVDLGYKFTKMGDSFDVKIDDLTDGSNATVFLICDYCGKEYSMKWEVYKRIHRKSAIDKDCCEECLQKKAKDAVDKKYGGFSEMFFSANDRRVSTNLERYGVENVFAADSVKDSIIKTNLAKYGVQYNQECRSVREKTEATCMERYGVKNYVELFRGKFIKENSPSWKGGTEHNNAERATFEYAQWRKAVFHRDNHTCQCCGRRSHKGATLEINAHHIANWKDNEALRYDVDNGATLCVDCHTLFHKIYGKRNNSKEQLDEFLHNQMKRYAELAESQLQEL